MVSSIPLAVVLFSRLSEAVDDQLRVGSYHSILTTLMAPELILPSSLY